MAVRMMVRRKAWRARSKRVTSKLLYNLDKFRVCAWKIQLLRKSSAKRGLEAFAECGDFCDVWPILTFGFVKNAFKLSNISGEGFVGDLLN
jgi:hypothetical protein